jgi:hypothetical protein
MTGGLDVVVRIGTAERERAAADLGEHFSAGRLTEDEFADRVRLAYEARTAADLVPLFADLPDLRPSRPPSHRPDLRPLLILLMVAACVAWVVFLRVPPFFVFPLMWIFFARRRFAPHRY